MPRLVLFHASCADGFCSAWICHGANPDAEFVAMQYGDEPPDVTGRDVLILDFSFPRAILLEMKSKAESLVVIDHHKTAAEALTGLDFCIFDVVKSGGRLTWEFFHPTEKSPWLVDYTEDRDLWRWKLPQSRQINAGLRVEEFDFSVWDELASSTDFRDYCATAGTAILRAESKTVQDHIKRAYEVEIDGYRVLMVNATTLVSEIAGELAKNRPFGVCWFETEKQDRVYSLRSTGPGLDMPEGIDVSVISKAHGGGGHKNAAGFTVPAFSTEAHFNKEEI